MHRPLATVLPDPKPKAKTVPLRVLEAGLVSGGPGSTGDENRSRGGSIPQIVLRGSERAVVMRLLQATGRCHHVVTHLAEQEADLQPRRYNVLQQRLGERAVQAAHAVVGRGA